MVGLVPHDGKQSDAAMRRVLPGAVSGAGTAVVTRLHCRHRRLRRRLPPGPRVHGIVPVSVPRQGQPSPLARSLPSASTGHAILWITSAHTALRVASGLIGSRIRCSTQALDCAFVAVTAAYAAVHLWETDKFIPGYWRGAPDAFVRDAMVPPHRSLSTLSDRCSAVRPPARRVSE